MAEESSTLEAAVKASLVPAVEAALVDWESAVDFGAHMATAAPPPEHEDVEPQCKQEREEEPAADVAPLNKAAAAQQAVQQAGEDLAPILPLSRVLQDDADCLRLPAPLQHLDQLRVVNTPSAGGQEGYHAAGVALRQRVVNTDLLTDAWFRAVLAPPRVSDPLSATLFELNDPRQFFEPNGPASERAGLGLDRAGALVLPMPPKVRMLSMFCCRHWLYCCHWVCVYVC